MNIVSLALVMRCELECNFLIITFTMAHKIPTNAIKVFDWVLFDIYQRQQELLDGSFKTYEAVKWFDASKWICVIDWKIIVTHEFQPWIEKRSLPGWMNNKWESSLDAVNREIKEELGYVFWDVKLLIDFPQTRWWFFKNRSYFICRDLVEISDRHVDWWSEQIEFELVDFETWVQRLLSWKIEWHDFTLRVKDTFVIPWKLDELKQIIFH